jgi:hypothetical protein
MANVDDAATCQSRSQSTQFRDPEQSLVETKTQYNGTQAALAAQRQVRKQQKIRHRYCKTMNEGADDSRF